MENEKEKNAALDKAPKEEKPEKKSKKVTQDTATGRTDTGENRTQVEIDPSLKEQLDAEGLDPIDLEELTMTQRLRRASIMRKYHSKLEKRRELAMKRNASMEIIMRRARKAAIKKIKIRKIGKSRDLSSLTPGEKQRLEDMLKKRKAAIARLARKLAPAVRGLQLQRMQREATEVKQDPHVGKRPGSQPAKYYDGVSKADKVERAKEFELRSKTDSRDASAYKNDIPGDKGVETKPSIYTQKYKKMYGESVEVTYDVLNQVWDDVAEETSTITEAEIKALKDKSEKSGVPYGTLKKVYNRGMAAWRTGHRPGTTPQQWAFARVNSYITKGKTYHTADKDLHEMKKTADFGMVRRELPSGEVIWAKAKKAAVSVSKQAEINDRKEEFSVEEDYRSAARYAASAHAGQKRSSGHAYISHPVRVANIVKKYKNSKKLDDLLSAAFLHDTIEDTDTNEEKLRKMFGELVASIVKELTSDKKEIEKVGKTNYLSNKMANMSSWALVIKLADRLDNVSDLETAKSDAWRKKYKRETEDILDHLEKNRELSGTHRRLISAIRGKLEAVTEEVKPENAPLAVTRTNIDRKTLDIVSRINKERRDKNKDMYRLAYYKQTIDDNNFSSE